MSAAVTLPRQRARVTAKGVLCLQCFTRQPRDAFLTNKKTGQPHTLCGGVPGLPGCKEKYRAWGKRSPDEKLASVRPFESDDAYSVGFVLESHNRKLGPIPVSRTARGSCPESCSFKNAGCFAEVSYSRIHWERVEKTGMSWDAFCHAVSKLKKGQLWRHNEAGDLPGKGEAIDPIALSKLVVANKGKRGFTFSHKPVLTTKAISPRSRSIPSHQERALWIVSNRRAIARAVRAGFAINLSADSIAQADELAALGIAPAPVAVVVPRDAPSHATKTPAGRQVVVCPNEAHGLTCDQSTPAPLRGDRPEEHRGVQKPWSESKYLVSDIVKARRGA